MVKTEMTDITGDDNNLQLLRVNHSVKMSEAFESMLSDESLCDISICCSGQVVRAHRLILAANSSYFKQILSGLNCQTQYPIIFVNGIHMQDLKAMLDFMYRGQVTIPQTQLQSLIKSAEVLGVSGLSQLDPNAHHLADNKSRTSSPEAQSSAGPAKRGRKRKKLLAKSEPNDAVSDSETHTKKDELTDNCEEMDDRTDADSDIGKGADNDKLAKSKLRSWSQQIAFKANHKDNQSPDGQQWHQSMADDSGGSEQSTGQNKKEVWRQSRARRPPLKYSEYTLPKGIQDMKTTDADTDADQSSVRPPTPRLTRGRSRVHSTDDPKVTIGVDSSGETQEPTGLVVSTSAPFITIQTTSATSATVTVSPAVDPNNPLTTGTTATTSAPLTPNTRSRRQTHSPSEGKSRESEPSSS